MHPEIAVASGAKLVERERELQRLATLIDEATRGEAGLLILEGPAGIGKTSLLAVARERAVAAGLRVLYARASDLERGYPFGIARQWFEPALAGASAPLRRRLLEGAARLAEPVVSPLATPADHEVSPSVLHGLYWLTANLASEQPLLLVVDDAHAADEASLRLLNYLAQRREGLPIGILVACRPPDLDEEGELLARLLAQDEADLLRPGPLDSKGIATILAAASGQEPEAPFVAACRDATGGNPFYLRELAQSLADAGASPTADNVDEIAAVRPQSLSRAILTRISPPARALAQALALLDEPADLALAADFAGLDQRAAVPAAGELTRAGLIGDEQPLEFVHAIVRAAVLSSLTAAERSTRHARAAELLRERGGSSEQISAHLLATEPASDPDAAATLHDAARHALGRGAPEAAVRLLRRALLEPLEQANRVDLLLDLGRAEREADVPEAAERFHEASRAATDPILRGEALRRLAWAIGSDQQGHGQIAGELDQAITIVRPLDRELALALEAARLSGLMLSPERHREMGERLERIGELAGATVGECVLLAVLARYLMDSGRPAREVAAAAERALVDPRTLELQGPDSLWLLNCSVALAQCERYEPLDALLARALGLARERGSASGFALVSTHRARIARRRGLPREAEADARAALASGALQSWYAYAASSLLIASLADQGSLDAARAAYDATGYGELLPDRRPLTPLLISRGALRYEQGEYDRALADLREALQRIGRYSVRTAAGMDARLLVVAALRRLGRREEALAEADEALAIAQTWGTAGMLGEALRARALIIGGEAGLAQLHEAVERLASSPLRLEHARVLIDLGAALRRSGRRADSREPLRTGLDLAERSGAAPLAQLARDELNASGIRVPRQRLGDQLTPSERRIVEIASGGATTPEIAQSLFVTTKTVETHLANAYRKLGIKSRRELPAALARSGESSHRADLPS